MANEVRVKGIVSWTYPYFGNNHVMPYGVLLVTDGVDEKACRIPMVEFGSMWAATRTTCPARNSVP